MESCLQTHISNGYYVCEQGTKCKTHHLPQVHKLKVPGDYLRLCLDVIFNSLEACKILEYLEAAAARIVETFLGDQERQTCHPKQCLDHNPLSPDSMTDASELTCQSMVPAVLHLRSACESRQPTASGSLSWHSSIQKHPLESWVM